MTATPKQWFRGVRTVVTGGAGFIGSTLVDALLDAGAEVAVVDDLSRGRREQVDERAEFHLTDIREPELDSLIAELAPEIVFHEAAQIDVRRSVSDPVHDSSVNLLGTVRLLQACVNAGVRRIVFASSGGALYGDTESIPTKEQHPCEPASVYGAAKLTGELYGRVFSSLHGIEFVPLRYGNVYGPRQDPHGEAGVVAIFAQRLLEGRETVINGDGRQTRDYVFVDDVVSANLAAAAAGSTDAFNVGTGRETDVNEIHRLIAAACASDRVPVHAPPKAGEQRRSCLDVSRARTGLGWAPRVDLETGIARTVDYFRGT